ncbi:MAG: DNA polymerase III subunit beta [Bdellovibrionia bacterium]
MIFSIDRAPLLEALQKVQSVVEKKNTIQILGNILCILKNQELSLCSTDLEVGIKVTLPVECEQEGKITLSAKHFLDIVKELPEKKLKITQKENSWIEILCGKSRFNIVSLPADQYPSLPSFEDKTYFQAKTASLIDMIDRTQFAASTDATRYHINGVYFECLENSLMRMTATDGHRLSFVDQEVFLTTPELKRGVIIPKKGLSEFRKFLDEGSDSIGLSFERGYMFSKLESSYLFIRLIDGEYPDYRPVIPKSADQLLKINRLELNSALKRVSLLANEKSRGVKLTIQTGSLVISSSNPDMGEAREEIDVEYTGNPIEIGFNSKYLLESLSVMKAEKLEFHLKDRLSPGILRELGQQNHTYVIMPMRI